MKSHRILITVFLAFSVAIISGCMTQQVKLTEPHLISAPEPIEGTEGTFMNPYTEDGVLAKWVDKAVNAEMGAQVGSLVGAQAGQAVLDQVPFIGGLFGEAAGEMVGRKIAIEMAGGMEYIKETSDSSFNTINDMALYLYANHSNHKHYQEALSATMAIYPELEEGYYPALTAASQ